MIDTADICFLDECRIFDTLQSEKTKSEIKTWVQVYTTLDKLIKREPDFEGPNLIVGNGREFIAQKIFGSGLTESGNQRPKQYYNYSLTHFAVGSGGVGIDGQSVTLLGPKISDKTLYQPITLGNEMYLNEPSTYVDTSETPVVHSYINSVKPIADPDSSTGGGSMYLESVEYDGIESFHTKLRCTCVVPPGEPAMLSPGGSVQVSEAGLYFTNPALTDVQMFSHICFAPKWIELETNFTILWYILC